MHISTPIVWAAATLALSVPALAQSKNPVLDEIQKLEAQVNQIYLTDPAQASMLKARIAKLSDSLVQYAPAGAATGSYSSVAANYSISGACGAFDSGTAGTTVSVASTATPIAIPDVASITDTVVIGGLGTQVFDVDLTVNITHTYAADLDISLTSPLGTIADVTSDNGVGNDNVFAGTLFDDESTNSVLTYPYVNLVAAPDLRPEQSFNTKFRGENPNGGWTLTIVDDFAVDIGTLNSWSLSVTDGTVTQILPSLGTPVVYSTGPISIPLPDVTTTTIPLVVTGGSTNIAQVQVYTQIQHTFNGDLLIQIQSPLGTTIDLSNHRGVGNDNVFDGTLFDMSSTNEIGSYVFTNLVAAPDLNPDGDLTGFSGENSNGTWNLIIADTVNLDLGSITLFELRTIDCGGGSAYCTGKINSQGCVPAIASTGLMSAVATSGFVLSASNELNNKVGLVLYSEFGRDAVPFGPGGLLCVKAPTRRSKGFNSGGSLPPALDCTGVFSIDFNKFARGLLGTPPNPAVYLSLQGQVVTAQFWGRDPGIPAPNNFSLSNGIEFTVGP